MTRFDRKVMLVTGAGRRIGRAIPEALAGESARYARLAGFDLGFITIGSALAPFGFAAPLRNTGGYGAMLAVCAACMARPGPAAHAGPLSDPDPSTD
jgi:hypothetical protein